MLEGMGRHCHGSHVVERTHSNADGGISRAREALARNVEGTWTERRRNIDGKCNGTHAVADTHAAQRMHLVQLPTVFRM